VKDALDVVASKVVGWRASRDARPPIPARTTSKKGDSIMAWTRPTLREICIGMEINGYLAGKL
jgi:coenzyme PQQ precursor peptide PqqA